MATEANTPNPDETVVKGADPGLGLPTVRALLGPLLTNGSMESYHISLALSFPIYKLDNHFISVAQSCLTLCYPMDCSTPGLPVYHQLLEFTQIHDHPVSDTIQPSHPVTPFSSRLQSFPPSGSFQMKWVYLSFSPLLFTSLLFTAICKASSEANHFAFLHFFFLITASCTVS